MNTPLRYIRAFFTALGMTLRGEKPPEPRHPTFVSWTREMVIKVDMVKAALEKAGIDATARKAITLKLDGRTLDLETIVGTLHYHAAQEYPSLLRSGARHSLMAVQATGINDLYWLQRLLEEPKLQQPAVQTALQNLAAHLEAIPPIQPANPQ